MNVESLVEVTLNEGKSFPLIIETLSRIGIASKNGNTLTQTCHILHKKGKYYIVHFKEMFLLDGKTSNITEEDVLRRNTICSLLEEWGLVTIVKPDDINNRLSLKTIKVVPHTDKVNWQFITKYTIGKKRT